MNHSTQDLKQAVEDKIYNHFRELNSREEIEINLRVNPEEQEDKRYIQAGVHFKNRAGVRITEFPCWMCSVRVKSDLYDVMVVASHEELDLEG